MITIKIPTREQIELLSGQREKTLDTIKKVIDRTRSADYTFRQSVRYLPVLGSEALCLHIDYYDKRISYDKLKAELEKIEAKARVTNRVLRARFDEKFMSAIDPLKNVAPSLYGELEEMVRSVSVRFNEPSKGACGDEAAEYSANLERVLCKHLRKELNALNQSNKPTHLNTPIDNGSYDI